jgi:hypothetical protein
MAIVQAQQQAREQKESVLDKVLKGVSLANQIMGTVENVQDLKSRPERLKQAEMDKALERRYKEAQILALGKGKKPDPGDILAREKFEFEKKQMQEPGYKLSKMGAEAQGKVGAIAEGLAAVSQMGEATEKGYGPRLVTPRTPLIGAFVSDDPYSSAQKTLTEVVGRLQSGGAIGAQELETFDSMAPRRGDRPEEKARKLEQQKRFLVNKLTAFGMKEEDLSKMGFQLYPTRNIEKKERGLVDIIDQGFTPVVRKSGSLADKAAQKLKEREIQRARR